MNDHNEALNEMIDNLRKAADELEAVRLHNNEKIDVVMSDLQSCCNTCTGVSFTPPCQGTCIAVSPLF